MESNNYYLAYTAQDLDEAIRKVLSGELDSPLQEKTVTPTTAQQIVSPDANYKGLSKVTVEEIPAEYTNEVYNQGYDAGYDAAKPYQTELNYIQSSGTQYFDTGLTAKNTTKIVVDCEITYLSDVYTKVLGSYTNGSNFSWWTNGLNLEAYYGNSYKSIPGQTGRMTLTADGNVWSANEESVTFTPTTFSDTDPVYLLSIRDGGNYVGTTMKMYSCQIYDNGTLVRDYIPVLDFDNVPCLYDKVKRKVYYNIGTGTFTYA